MKYKNSVTTKLLVVLSAALVGLGIGYMFCGVVKVGLVFLGVAILSFAFAVVTAYAKNKSILKANATVNATQETAKPTQTPQESNDFLEIPNQEEKIDEAQFEEVTVQPSVVNPEVAAPKVDETSDVVDEFAE